MLRIDAQGLTDVGLVRPSNQDAFALIDLSRGSPDPTIPLRGEVGERGVLVLVSDGMGGEAAGDVASRLAVRVVAGEMGRFSADGDIDAGTRFATALAGALEVANEAIKSEGAKHSEERGMGATMTVAGILGERLYVAQVGDSLCYMLARGRLSQLTADQALVRDLVIDHRISEEEAAHHGYRNVILQALGKSPTLHPEIIEVPRHQLGGDGAVIRVAGPFQGMRLRDGPRRFHSSPLRDLTSSTAVVIFGVHGDCPNARRRP